MNKRKIILLILINIIFGKCITINAANVNKPHFDDESRNFIYITTDHKATSGIKWKNVGFNITLTKTNGNPFKDKKCITIYYDEVNAGHKVHDNGDGTKTTTYFIKGDYLKKKIDQKYGKGYYENKLYDGRTIYFNDIFQVTHNGKDYGSMIHTLAQIKNAEPWSDNALKDFPSHFDISVKLLKVKQKIEKAYVLYKTYQKGKWISLDGPKELEQSKWGKAGTKVNHKLAIEKKIKNTTYILYASYYTRADKPNSKQYNRMQVTDKQSVEQVRTQKGEMPEGGILFVGIMKEKTSSVLPEEKIIEKEVEFPVIKGIIGADERGEEKFDVEDGIPVTESLYANVTTNSYLCGYRFIQKRGEKEYPVTVKRVYNLIWNSNKKEKTQKVTLETKVNIKRYFQYWLIDNLDVLGLDYAVINNQALPKASIKLTPKAYRPPAVWSVHQSTENYHIEEPSYPKEIFLPAVTLYSKEEKPSVPQEEFQIEAESQAQKAVGKLKVRNDGLVLNGQTLMDNSTVEEKTMEPLMLSDAPMIDSDVLFEKGLVIDTKKQNGEYHSDGKVVYKKIAGINSNGIDTEYDMEEINNVVVHTPVVCDGRIEDKKAENQMTTPDKTVASLVLDTDFYVTLPTSGQHLFIKGYGYKDYNKYTSERQIRFPFDVYQNGIFIRAGTWIKFLHDEKKFYLPIWVKEGHYTIGLRTISINTSTEDDLIKTEKTANLDLENYVAEDTIDVEVSGRIYNLSLYDISDYPVWKNVFRMPDSLKLTGFQYSVGSRDQKGRPTGSAFTFPLINGSHPFFRNAGTVKPGYTTRFHLTTISGGINKEDGVAVNVSFYHVNKDGTGRKPVDVYYPINLDKNKKQLIKIGSKSDSVNLKELWLGNPYLTIPASEMVKKADYMSKKIDEIRSEKKNVWSYGRIFLPSAMQMYIGDEHEDVKKYGAPSEIKKNRILAAKQKWYFEYSLPSAIHVVPRDYPVPWQFKKRKIDFHEPFWIKDGYLILHFDITLIKKGEPYLNYENKINAENGYCNMWEKEGFIKEKTDYKKNRFLFENGDILLYSIEKSAKKDYHIGGTH